MDYPYKYCKKIVRYIDIKTPLVVGQSALVYPKDHPKCSNASWAKTSPVVRIVATHHGPVFVTKNTIYVPVADEEIIIPGQEELGSDELLNENSIR